METGAVRPYTPIVHDPPPRRDDVVGSHVTTELPTEKTVRAAQAATDGRTADAASRRQDHPAVRTGFERNLDTGAIVYRWIDQTTERVILEIPRTEKIRSVQSYLQADTSAETDHTVDRSA